MPYNDTLRRLVSTLERRLPKEFIVSVRPDHPHLLESPDIIVGGRGVLSAIFVPKARELQNPEILLARLIGSRLAFPSEIRCFLTATPLIADDFSLAVSEHFDRSFELTDLIHLIESIQEIEGREISRSVPAQIRNQARNRYQLLFNVANLRHRIRPIGANPRELLISLRDRVPHEDFDLMALPLAFPWSVLKTRRPKDSLNYRGCEIATVSLIRQRINFEVLTELCTYSLTRSYGLDRGIPYIGREINPNILLVNRWPEEGQDPLKAVRAAAFAGWALTAAETPEEIVSLTDRLQRDFEKHIR